ncbi:MAG: hypothetical protein RSF70_08410 [Ruthenibacterium sp.]
MNVTLEYIAHMPAVIQYTDKNNYAVEAIREKDMVCTGCYTPDVSRRNSPLQTDFVLGATYENRTENGGIKS